MRNLKRALSLTLASVMLLGMMVVGSSAAKGYDDVKETDNVEAIEVAQAIEVMVGDERGFGPDRPVNRAEMAVVMGKLLNLDYDYYATSCPFNDVYDWARGWVGACYANKIVSGRGEGVYDPGATVTAVEAASMLMRALGYFQYQNDYADGFELSTVRQGTKIRIFDNVGSSATEPMTRNQVAQMVLNALQTGMVEPDGQTINLTTPEGQVYTGKVNYVNVTSNKDFAYAISNVGATSIGSQNTGAIVELGEQLYNGDLKLHNYEIDAFGRPSRNWEYKGNDIGTYEKKELLKKEWTTKVTGKDLYDLLTKNTIETYDFLISIDGETEKAVLNSVASKAGEEYFFTQENMIRTNTKAVGGTGNGVLTQVFVDPNEGKDGKVYVSIINTYLAIADKDYDAKKDEVSYTVWDLTEYNKTGKLLKAKADDTKSLPVKGDEFDIADVKEDDVVLVHVAEGEIKEILKPEVIDNTTISAFKTKDYVEAAEGKYDYSDTAMYDTEVLDKYDKFNMKDTTYRVFLDKYGYAIGVEIIEEPDQYVFLTGIDGNTSNLRNKTADGYVIHIDGTSEEVKINMEKSKQVLSDGTWGVWNRSDLNALMNTWCTYTVDTNGVYTLTEIANNDKSFKSAGNATGQSRDASYGYDTAGTAKASADHWVNTDKKDEILTIDKKRVSLTGIASTDFTRVYGNDDTVYLSAETALIGATNVVTADNQTKQAVIINGIDAVTTGVQNANLKAWDATTVVSGDADYRKASNTAANKGLILGNVSNGVYTLFKDNGFVIAAVVVGEDEGNSTSYAYITSGNMNREAYDAAKDEYTWSRDVVINGQKTTLTEKGDQDPYISAKTGHMQRNEWWEVKFNAEGNVRKATKVTFQAANGVAGPAAKFVGEIVDVEPSVLIHDTVVLHQNMTDKLRDISVKGNTLQIDNDVATSWGFAVASNAKIVLVQDAEIYRNGVKTGDKDYMADVTEYDNGIKGLEKMVKDLNDHFQGYLSAVFEGGVATSVVVYDTKETDVEIGGDTSVTDGIIRVDSSDSSDVKVYYVGNTPDDKECLDAIVAHLRSRGLTIEDVRFNSTTSNWEFVTSGGTYNLTYLWAGASKKIARTYLTVNGSKTDVGYNASTAFSAIASAAGITDSEKIGKFAKVTEMQVDGKTKDTWQATSGNLDTTATVTLTATSKAVQKYTAVEFGYYEIQITEGITNSAATNGNSAVLKVAVDSKDIDTATAGTIKLYVKAGATTVSMTGSTDKATSGKVTLSANTGSTNVGTVVGSGTIDKLNSATDTFKVNVSLTKAEVIGTTPTIVLTANDTVETVTINVKLGKDGTAKPVQVKSDGSDKWLSVLSAAGFDPTDVLSTYIRRDDDWTKGVQVTASAAAGDSTVALDATKTYTVGCIEVTQGTHELKASGTDNLDLVISTGIGYSKTVTNDSGKMYMATGEKFKVEVKNNATGAVATNTTGTETITIGLDGTTMTGTTWTAAKVDFTGAAAGGTALNLTTAVDSTTDADAQTVKITNGSNWVATDLLKGTGSATFEVTVGTACAGFHVDYAVA